jgi:hypothetical protein
MLVAIKEEIILNCEPEIAFTEVAKLDFARKIGFASDIENEVLYQNDRIIKYIFKAKYQNIVRSLESERIIIPENLTIITQRRNLSSAKYNVIIDIFKKREAGTIMTHIDEFEEDDQNISDETLNNMKITTKMYMTKLAQYFN